jgi:hypothetical protein
VVVPGAQYEAGGLRRFLLGAHYRDIWTTAIDVPYLDLGEFAGGLTPISSHVGSQTTSLRFQGADGRRYQFRRVFKTPTAGLAPELQGTLIADLLQDGASASHPVGALVVAPLLSAVDVLYPEPSLAVMPDDPLLGEFREDFRGMLGIIEERPNEADDGSGGFGDALRVIGPDRLFERIDDGPEDQVDVHSFLTARLLDILIGDRDRHRDNFRWALMDDSGPIRYWVPISRDHDKAFVNLDGLLVIMATEFYPQMVSFGSQYPDPLNLNWHAREIDRRFLVGLDKMAWDSVSRSVQARLTDEVIRDAVLRLPPAMHDASGQALERRLLSRRDLLAQEADRYYRLLAEDVEIHATNAAEVAEITLVDERFLDVSIREEGGEPYLHRRFDELETDEVRISLWGGADRVLVRGDGEPSITIRVVGGRGRDTFTDSSRMGGVRFYDTGDNTRADLGRSHLDRKRYPEWIGSDVDRYPPREWGTFRRRFPWVMASSDMGLLVGGGVRATQYGFRKSPYAADWTLRGGVATGHGWGAMEFDGKFRRENSNTLVNVEAHISGVEILNFHGSVNDTERDPTVDSYRVPMDELWIHPTFEAHFNGSIEVGIGPWLRLSRTDDDDNAFFAALADTLYGAGRFGRVGRGRDVRIGHQGSGGRSDIGRAGQRPWLGSTSPLERRRQLRFRGGRSSVIPYRSRTAAQPDARPSRRRAEGFRDLPISGVGVRGWPRQAARLVQRTVRGRCLSLWKRGAEVRAHTIHGHGPRGARVIWPRRCGSRLRGRGISRRLAYGGGGWAMVQFRRPLAHDDAGFRDWRGTKRLLSGHGIRVLDHSGSPDFEVNTESE